MEEIHLLRIDEKGKAFAAAITTLREMGYTIKLLPKDKEGLCFWSAKKDYIELIGINPLSLLGLAVLWSRKVRLCD